MTAADTPTAAIARLEGALARRGETVTIRRYTAATGTPRPKTDVAGIKAHVRAVRADELVGSITQNDSKVIMSPTGISALLPLRKGDKVLVADAEKNVEFASHIRVQDVLVRIELTVTG
ncbi:hypothetical protein [Mesorhizobium sp. YM1C-6-2]|uniref:hypothetical protein n=1 Tax=Mesorhizobium sp. YM1C-6-2 TaxID=1827501 RepID=UPI000EF1A3C3|nr:hypothetical protein [Mesorhizobium sp. YM1C-6-2]RLP22263.1 hypothetical protein D8676_25320 [Mesorhizobium sp. YM1C-6-2]